MKTNSGDIIILHMFTKNHNNMMYGSWDTEWDRQNYLSFWAIFCPFTPQTIWRYYHSGDIITLYLCTINDNHMMYASRDMECDRQNVIFLSFWTVFCPLPSPPPPPPPQWKFWKMKHTPRDIIILHLCTTKMTFEWCMIPEIWSATNRIFCHFDRFFALLPP